MTLSLQKSVNILLKKNYLMFQTIDGFFILMIIIQPTAFMILKSSIMHLQANHIVKTRVVGLQAHVIF